MGVPLDTSETAHRRLWSENRSEERLLTLTFPVPAGYRLGNEDIDGEEAEWNSVEPLKTV
ncbi:hypothetical protein DPMN_010248 [Dreissena polymorpha]|uniref:Uncharacterized protein n=1 Tax=Dreissena polymorpha TaxID=45954 RepID=A0A9D4RZ20_DREPO|nr:hypothetical protein DPMN_010248 [Dreissena polymorpha]